MKKKGFTLLELLAVIIILAVIALITTPIVLNVVDEAKKSAFQDSTYGLIKSGEYYYTSKLLNGGMTNDKVFNFPNNTELEFSGTEPKSGYIKVTKEGLVEIAVSDGKYCATKGINEEVVTIVEGECTVGNKLQAPTISLNGDVLNITQNDERTEKYEIYVDGELKTTIAAQQAAAAGVAEVDGENVIKAGTYRFNDVLTKPSAELVQVISFETVPSEVTFEDETIHLSFISLGVDDANGDVYYALSGRDSSIIYTETDGFYWNVLAFELGDTAYNGLGQIITIPYDQEVSEEFYEWFTANAVEVKEISGKWKFNDVLTQNVLGENIPSWVNECRFYSNGNSFDVIGLIVAQFSGTGENVNVFQLGFANTETFNEVLPYTSAAWNDFSAGWLDDAYKLIDFGTEPQYVSAEFYDWFVANANQIGISYDLTNLNLEEGTYSIKIKAKADGYVDSNFSNEIIYAVKAELPESGETQEPEKNEDGFYYNVPYVTENDFGDGPPGAYVFYDDNTMIVFVSFVDDIEEMFAAYGPFEFTYDETTRTVTDENDYTYIFSEDGKSFNNGTFTFVAAGVEHGVYYGDAYVSETGKTITFAEDGTGQVVGVGENYTENNVKWTLRGHFATSSIGTMYVSTDGNVLFWENEGIFVRGAEVRPYLEVCCELGSSAENPANCGTNRIWGFAWSAAGIKSVTVNGVDATIDEDGNWIIDDGFDWNSGEIVELVIVVTDNENKTTTKSGFIKSVQPS